MKTLNNITVLNTRPYHQAAPLSKQIVDLGGKVIDFPTMEIIPIKCEHCSWSHIDIAIFTSANAVCLKPNEIIPAEVTVIAIGPGTAARLAAHTTVALIIPESFNSEGLLALPILEKVNDKKLVIFCGENPRPLLKDTLTERNANVTVKLCYRRVLPKYTEKQKATVLNTSFDIIISTSLESLQNLFSLQSRVSTMLNTTLLVISPKMKCLAEQLGWKHVIVAANASDHAILYCMLHTPALQKHE